ncbi:hypothetical protein FRC11_011628 [Ceratobasidium sp. 423]|nr:hypothetical protein FRC11_011628 [Ceratobasidium sp. 423]
MPIPDGRYRIWNAGNPVYRLSYYDGVQYVQANDSSNTTVEIQTVTEGQRIRFNDPTVSPSTTDWFGYENNFTSEDSRVVQSTGKQGLSGENLIWAITPAGPGIYSIKIWNDDYAWTLPEDPKNPSDIYLRHAEGEYLQLWNIQPVD